MPKLPAGWYAHPNDPSLMHNGVVTAPIQWLPDTPAAPAAPAMPATPAPQPVAAQTYSADPTYYQPQGAPPQLVSSVITAKPPNAYNVSKIGNDILWVNLPELPKTVGSKVSARLRLIALTAEHSKQNLPYLLSAQHQIPAEFFGISDDQVEMVRTDCFDIEGGPGDCPVCAAIRELTKMSTGQAHEYREIMKQKKRAYAQALDLNHFDQHLRDVLDASNNPMINPQTGAPYKRIVPGVFELKRDIIQEFINLQKDKGIDVYADSGAILNVWRYRRGPAKMDVTWGAEMEQPHRLSGSSLENVLYNGLDLASRLVNFRDRAQLQDAIDKLMAAAKGPESAWGPSTAPGYEFNPQLNQFRPAGYQQPYAPPQGLPPGAPLPVAPAAHGALPPAAYAPPAAPPPAGGYVPPPPAAAPSAAPAAAATGQVMGAPPPPPPGGFAAPPMPPAQPAPPPMPPGAPLPPPTVQSAAVPPPPVGVPAAAPAAPPTTPPAGPPAAPPAAPPAGPPAAPPAAPPPPPPPATPPAAGAAPNGAMSPAALEQSMAASGGVPY